MQWATAVKPGGMEQEHPVPDHDPCCTWGIRVTPFLGPQGTIGDLPTQDQQGGPLTQTTSVKEASNLYLANGICPKALIQD